MKGLLRFIMLFTVLVTAVFPASGQRDCGHTPRDGDRLHPGVASSRSLILSVCDSARRVLIDPDAVAFDGMWDASPYIDGDTVSYVQFATKQRFLLRSDTLSYTGYENRATLFRLERPADVAAFPLKEGTEVRDAWSGNLLHYGTMMLKRARGESRTLVQKGWTVTDGADTLRNVTRLVWTLDMAYADPDSVTSSMPDSVASGMISGMRVDVDAVLSERLLTERTMWFAEDARYPVLTDSRVSRILLDDGGTPRDTVPVSALAMHYPRAWQYSDTGEEIPARDAEGLTRGTGYASYGNEDPDNDPSLTVGKPEVNGNSVTVTLCSKSGPVEATVTLFTDSGIRLKEPLTVTVGNVPRICSVEAPSGWSGVILLRVEAGEESYTEKIIR